MAGRSKADKPSSQSGGLKIKDEKITGPISIETQMEQTNSLLAEMVEILQYPAQNLQDYLDNALARIIEITKSRFGYIYFYDEEKKEFNLNTWSGLVMKECTIADPQFCYKLDKTGIWGEVVRQRKPIVINDFKADNPLKKGYPKGHVKLTRFVSLPVIHNGKIVAAIGLANKKSDYTSTDVLEIKLLVEAIWKSVDSIRSQVALRESEARYRELVENANSIILRMDNEGNIIFFNEYAQKFFGYSCHEALGRNVVGTIVPETDSSGRNLKAMIADIFERPENYADNENENICKDGRKVWVSWTNKPLYDDTGKVHEVLCIGKDITERKQAEQENRRFRTISDNAVYGKAIADLEGNLFYINRFFANIHGYEPEEVIGKNLSLFHSREQQEAVDLLNASMMKEGAFAPTTVWHRHKDGTDFPMLMSGVLIKDDYGNPQFIAASAIDMTAHHQAAAKLAQSEEKFRQISQNIGEVFWLRDADKNKMLYVNPAYEKVWGRTCQSLYDNPESFMDSVVEQDKQAVFAEFKKYVNGGRFDLEYRIARPDGEIRWVRAQTFPVKNPDGKVVGDTGIAVDITERKQFENDLRKKTQLLQNITDNMFDLVAITSLDGVFSYAGPSHRILGYEPEQLLGTSVFEYVHPKDIGHILKAFDEFMENPAPDKSRTVEYRQRCADGSYLWLETVGKFLFEEKSNLPYALFFSSRNITQRKIMEDALKASQIKYKTMFDLVPVGITLSDSSGNIVESNRESEKLLGLTKKQHAKRKIDDEKWLIIRPDGSFMPPEEYASTKALVENRRVENSAMGIVRGNNETVWLNVTASPIPLEDYGVAIAYSDITQRKLIEDTLIFLAETGHLSADEVLPVLVRQIAVSQKMKYALIAKVDSNDLQTAHTVAVWSDDRYGENFSYPLAGTPCYRVASSGPCFYPSEIQKLFPNDHLLVEMGAESYWGTPLLNSAGEVLGIMAVLHDKPIDNNPQTYAILQTFALRAAGELERLAIQEELNENERRFMDVLYASDDAIMLISENRFVDCNDATVSMLKVNSRNECLELHPSQLSPPTQPDGQSSFEKAEEMMQLAYKKGFHRFEWIQRRINGEDFPVEVSLTPIIYGGKNLLHCVWRDITKQKEADAKLWLQSLVLDQISDHVTITDFNGNITYVNQAEAELLNLDRKEIIGKKIDIYGEDPDYGASQKQILEKTLNIGKWRGEVVNIAADGKKCVMDCRTQLIYDESGSAIAVCGVCTDITHRKFMEDALKASETRYRSLVEGLPDIIISFDQNGRHLFISENVEYLANVSAARFIGKTHREMGFPEKVCELWENAIKEVFESKKPFETEYTHEGFKDEVVFNVRLLPSFNPQGDVDSVLSIIRDVTAYRKSERDYQTLFTKMMGAFALHEIILNEKGQPVDYRFLAVNPAFEQLTGLKADLIIGKTVLEVLPETEPYWIETYGRVALTGEALHFESFSGALGKFYEVTAFRTATNQFAAIFLDITERKMAEQEREKLQVQLIQAQKMETVGRLAGGVAHDFNNMLGVILAHTEMALDSLDSSHPLFADLRAIGKAAERSAELTRQLLAFARKQNIEPKIIDINQTVETMIKMLGRLLGEDIEIAWLPGADLPQVKMDTAQVHQILTNLCVNARDAIDGVGKVIIKTDRVEFDEAYCAKHSGFVPGEFVSLSVIDNGQGIPEELMDNIFEPFFTTKDIGKGTGLGLSTVYGIVRQNRGFINVHSQPGQGSNFTIYLLAQRGIVDKSSLAKSEFLETSGKETILIVEDSPDMLKATKMILERIGYTAIACSMPNESFRMAENYAGKIDLLLTDIVMPEMNGRDLAKKMLALYPDMKCLFMSGYTANILANEKTPEQDFNFIEKPFSMKDLASKVREVLDKK